MLDSSVIKKAPTPTPKYNTRRDKSKTWSRERLNYLAQPNNSLERLMKCGRCIDEESKGKKSVVSMASLGRKSKMSKEKLDPMNSDRKLFNRTLKTPIK